MESHRQFGQSARAAEVTAGRLANPLSYWSLQIHLDLLGVGRWSKVSYGQDPTISSTMRIEICTMPSNAETVRNVQKICEPDPFALCKWPTP
jgi:hypothetical protein